jgi:hypothetical protein
MQLFDIPKEDFLKYNQLISCIPKEWKNKIKDENLYGNQQRNILDNFFKAKKPVKVLYKYQIQNEEITEIKPQKIWETMLDERNINWKKVYTVSFKCTLNQTLRNFQYKYLMQIIRCNDFLCKYGIVNSNLCDFCSMCTETQRHLFWECNLTQTFWSNLRIYLNSKELDFKVNFKIISLGIISEKESDKLFNFIIIYAKYFIYSCKLQDTYPNINVFKNKLTNIMQIDKQIALNQDKLYAYETKWQHF